MDLFKLARRYPNAANETEAIKAAEAEILDLDTQMSVAHAKRADIASMIDYKPTEARAKIQLSNRSNRNRKDGVTEYLYTNNAYSYFALRLGVGTRDSGQNACHVWLSRAEAEAICDLKNQDDSRRDLRLVASK
jgi:hypothetical protein